MTRKAAPPHEVRIIGGLWKRTKLPVPDKPGLRPTPDRVRETLFNWLGQDLAGWRCVDVFAGSGALGLEAASRGAADVLLVEQDPELVGLLRTAQSRLDAKAVKVERGNGLSVLGRIAPGSIDLVFLDPPFDAGLLPATLAALDQRRLLAQEAFVYIEMPAKEALPVLPAGWRAHRQGKAGEVGYHLLLVSRGAP